MQQRIPRILVETYNPESSLISEAWGLGGYISSGPGTVQVQVETIGGGNMTPKRIKKDDNPSVLSPNPFSLLDSAPQRLTETPTRPRKPRVLTRPSTPRLLHDIVLEIP
jgi:hypothetical protein